YRRTLEAAARAHVNALRNDGTLSDARAKVHEAERYTAEYYLPHLAHASMEPPAATVLVKGDRCEVWTSVQDPQAALNTVAARLKLKPENVTVNVLLLGGAFGRKSKPDFVDEAAIVAQPMRDTPVKLVWTREDDIHHDYLHAVAVERLEAVVGKNGQPETWLHRSAAPTMGSLFSEGAKGLQVFEAAMSAINMPYLIPHVRIETAEVEAH